MRENKGGRQKLSSPIFDSLPRFCAFLRRRWRNFAKFTDTLYANFANFANFAKFAAGGMSQIHQNLKGPRRAIDILFGVALSRLQQGTNDMCDIEEGDIIFLPYRLIQARV